MAATATLRTPDRVRPGRARWAGVPDPEPCYAGASSGPAERARSRLRIVRELGSTPLTFASGHQLALRLACSGTGASSATVAWRPPEGGWSILWSGDGEAPGDGLAAEPSRAEPPGGTIVHWTGGPTIHVRMPGPGLDWILRLRRSSLIRSANRILERGRSMDERGPVLPHVVEDLARRALGSDDVPFDDPTTGRHVRVRRVFLVGDARASLDGADLGRLLRGPGPWLAGGILAEGDAIPT
ncbi:MAG TPA: hypothetical protein VLL48_10390 [Longimicrobiales bacterium]|nr:hypothetical protein [Longimicrobiales bacterium]